ncbi:Integrase core domain protein [compost metagenome]
MIKYLCECIGVSRSGYYNYLNNEKFREIKETLDEKVRDIILIAYNKRGFKKGAKSIKMVLEKEHNIIYNLKRIRRIMKKYNITCPFRKANPYRKIAKATKEHSTVENKLKRKFKEGKPKEILLTDITYLFYGKSKKCYLSVIKDSVTNEILVWNLSENLTLDISIDTIKKLKNKKFKINSNAYIHSDQGVHYTSPTFQKILKKYKIGQSMSRRGNCWDNAPQESFFGHMKDEINLENCTTYEDVYNEIKRYINYYNNFRYQWNLKKMTPVEYRNHLLYA